MFQAPQPAHLAQQRSGHHSVNITDKKDPTQLSPVKKRVKENSPAQSEQYRQRNSPHHWQQQQLQHQQQHYPRSNRQPTITIEDTPSPAVSVITISDSDDEGANHKSVRVRGQQQQQQRGHRQVRHFFLHCRVRCVKNTNI